MFVKILQYRRLFRRERGRGAMLAMLTSINKRVAHQAHRDILLTFGFRSVERMHHKVGVISETNLTIATHHQLHNVAMTSTLCCVSDFIDNDIRWYFVVIIAIAMLESKCGRGVI